MYTSVHQPVGILKINGIRTATAAFNSISAQITNGFFTNQNDLIVYAIESLYDRYIVD